MRRYTIYGPPTFVDGTLVPGDVAHVTCGGLEVSEGALQFYNEITKHWPNGKAYTANEFFMIIAQGHWTKVDIQHLHEPMAGHAPQGIDEELPPAEPMSFVDDPVLSDDLPEIEDESPQASAPENV